MNVVGDVGMDCGNGEGIVSDAIDSEHGNAKLDKNGAGVTTVQWKVTAQTEIKYKTMYV